MLVTLDSGRKFIVWSVSGSDDDLICKTKREHENDEYAVNQNFNDFWEKITGLTPKYYEGCHE